MTNYFSPLRVFAWPPVPACQGCVHYRDLYYNGRIRGNPACHYLLDIGHSRPCESGPLCTVKTAVSDSDTEDHQ